MARSCYGDLEIKSEAEKNHWASRRIMYCNTNICVREHLCFHPLFAFIQCVVLWLCVSLSTQYVLLPPRYRVSSLSHSRCVYHGSALHNQQDGKDHGPGLYVGWRGKHTLTFRLIENRSEQTSSPFVYILQQTCTKPVFNINMFFSSHMLKRPEGNVKPTVL